MNTNTRDSFPVIELFGPTLQGEGILAGQVSHFLRFGGCGRRCSFCDSMHAVDPEQVKKNAAWASSQQIVKGVLKLGAAPWITLTGGDPALWELDELISLLTLHHRIAVETQGDIYRGWLTRVDLLTISPKPPSAAGPPPNYEVIERLLNGAAWEQLNPIFKVVIFTAEDFLFAKDLHQRYPQTRLFLSSGTPVEVLGEIEAPEVSTRILEGYRRVTEMVLGDPEMHSVTVLPQLHALLWGTKKGH